MQEELTKFFETYFTNSDNYKGKNKIRSLHFSILLTIFDTNTIEEILNNHPQLYADYKNIIYNYLSDYINGDPTKSFRIDRLRPLNIDRYPEEFTTYLQWCIGYYFSPRRPLPINFDINSPQHRCYATIKIIRCVSEVNLERLSANDTDAIRQFRISRGLGSSSVLTLDDIKIYRAILNERNQEDLLAMVAVCERISRNY